MNNEALLIKNVIEATLNELDKKRIIKKKILTPYQKTEQVLFSYNDYKIAVNDKYEKIEEIKKYGVSKHSGSIIPMPTNTGYKETKFESDKQQEAIETLEKSIILTKRFIAIIDDALEKIKDDPYSDLIRMIYFEKQSNEDVADYFNVDSSTIRRNRKTLIKKLSIYLFSDDVISELFT